MRQGFNDNITLDSVPSIPLFHSNPFVKAMSLSHQERAVSKILLSFTRNRRHDLSMLSEKNIDNNPSLDKPAAVAESIFAARKHPETLRPTFLLMSPLLPEFRFSKKVTLLVRVPIICRGI